MVCNGILSVAANFKIISKTSLGIFKSAAISHAKKREKNLTQGEQNLSLLQFLQRNCILKYDHAKFKRKHRSKLVGNIVF